MTECRQFGSHRLPPDLIYIYIYAYINSLKDEMIFSLSDFAGKGIQKNTWHFNE